jgi:glycosyltransferase involved in cell wall biosynthesis
MLIIRLLIRRFQQKLNYFTGRLFADDAVSSASFDRDYSLEQDLGKVFGDSHDHTGWFSWRGRQGPVQPAGSKARRLWRHVRGYDVGSVRRKSSRIDADWEFLVKTSAVKASQEKEHPISATSESSSSFVGCDAAALVKAKAVEADSRNGDLPMNVVIINHGSYDNNSAIHVSGFANALSALGHRVVVSATGAIWNAGDFGFPSYRCVPHELLKENVDILSEHFAGVAGGKPHLVHCWTPRQVPSGLARAVIERYNCPYIVHFEDNESAVARRYDSFEIPLRPADKPFHATIDEFIRNAAGATIIVDALRELLPEGLPVHLLEPGVDNEIFRPRLDFNERERVCDALGVPSNARITVYPGNLHAANYDDMFSLYVAVHALNALGQHVHLIRTGVDHVPAIDPRFAELASRHVTNLGFVRREWLIDLLRLSDFFVQPGGPDDFNRYRLPCKIPELLAIGRPLILPSTNIGLLMQHRVNALLMVRGDAAEITECVQALLDSPKLADRVGQEGRRFAMEHFNWKRSTKQLEGFYREVLRRS